jgi:outer membrane protein
MLFSRSTICLIIISIVLAITTAQADEVAKTLPKWELGLAVGAASLPQYMGSDERYTFGAPLPYFVYRGDRIKMDRGGLRATLFDIERLTVDVSLGAGLPVRNSNRARAGMPELKFNLQAGPRLNWSLYQSQWTALNLRLPVRGILDTSGDFLGWLSEPDIQIRYKPSSDVKIELTGGLLFATRKYHSTFYDVAPAFATATRPSYRSGAGLHSVSATAKLIYRYSDTITLFSALRYRNLTPGTVANSPLVKDRNYISITAGMAWSLFQSDELSRDSEDD